MHNKFLIQLFGLTFVIAALLYALKEYGFFVTYVGFVWYSLIFLTLTTIVVYFIMQRAMKMKEHSNFVAAFGMGFAIKSFASLAFIAYFIFFNPIKDSNFIFPFFFMYFAYTGLLVWDIWQSTKGKKLP